MHPSPSLKCFSVRAFAALFLLLFTAAWPGGAAAQQSTAAPGAPASTTDPALKANPNYTAAMAEAKKREFLRQFGFAEDYYRKACKIADGKDPNCLNALFALQLRRGDYKDALKTVDALGALATTPESRAVIALDRGTVLYQQAGEKARPEQLEAADAAFHEALAEDPKNAQAHYMDGYVLARLHKLDAAKEQFQQCLSCMTPKDPSYTRLQHFVDNPEMVTAKMAPPFTVVALDGSKFNLDAMDGRVVLIDFWATWCGPCNEELPNMKHIAKEFAGEPLVILSVSWDADEAKWKQFIARNEMTWPQYRDANHDLSRRFGVDAIPHYFTIDSDGVLTAEIVGSGSNVEGRLKKLLARAKAEKQRDALSAGAQ
jgi:thiol-disulfide isomerase/thioredoxin/Flp pilus assembly protein TadD